MSAYKAALDDFLRMADQLPTRDRHVPDELCALIETHDDFRHLLDFVVAYHRSDHLEYGFGYGSESTPEFLAKLARLQTNAISLGRAREIGIRSELGLQAYLMILALGN